MENSSYRSGSLFVKILLAIGVTFALLFGGASAATAAPKPAPSKSVTYSAPNNLFVDDDGKERAFFITYNYNPDTGLTTCSYSINGREINNPAHPGYQRTSLLVLEGTYRTTTQPVATSGAEAIEFCKSKFNERTRFDPDPTI